MASKPRSGEPMRFSKEERAAIVERIQRYFVDELDSEIGSIPAELLLQFLTDEIGPFFYNRGLGDAQAVLRGKVDEFHDAIYALEDRAARVRDKAKSQ